MRKVWIVVANSGLAKFYRAESAQVLVEHDTFIHPASHLKNSDLVSDGQGQEQRPAVIGSDTYESKTSPKEKEFAHFAKQIADFLAKGALESQYEHLYIVCKPPFLGYLRQAISPHVAQYIQSETHKDLTSAKASEIRDYLPPVL